ncbi:MAG: amidase family protein, partial [Acidimicrobiia bacterium]
AAMSRPRTAALVAEGFALGEGAVARGIDSSQRLRIRLEATMDTAGIAVWLSPAATGPAPPGLDYIGDPVMATPWTHAHLPVITIPAGVAADGLPLGLQIAGHIGADEELVAQARSIETILGGR